MLCSQGRFADPERLAFREQGPRRPLYRVRFSQARSRPIPRPLLVTGVAALLGRHFHDPRPVSQLGRLTTKHGCRSLCQFVISTTMKSWGDAAYPDCRLKAC